MCSLLRDSSRSRQPRPPRFLRLPGLFLVRFAAAGRLRRAAAFREPLLADLAAFLAAPLAGRADLAGRALRRARLAAPLPLAAPVLRGSAAPAGCKCRSMAADTSSIAAIPSTPF